MVLVKEVAKGKWKFIPENGKRKKDKRGRHKVSRAELQPNHRDLRRESITQSSSATTAANPGFALSSALPATAGAIQIAANGQVKVNSGVDVSNATAAWIFVAVAAFTTVVIALATR